MAFPTSPTNGQTYSTGGVVYVYSTTTTSWQVQTYDNIDAASALAKIKTVDGAGTGLDADLFDGLNSTQFLRSDTSAAINGSLTANGTLTVRGTVTNNELMVIDNYNGSGFYQLDFRWNNAEVGSVSVTSSGATYNTTSDRRLKDNINTITNGKEKLLAMNPVTHTWKADPNGDAVHGFIAQEMHEVVPEAVSGEPDGDDMMSMDYGRITPVIVAALQDALKEIEELKTRINELEAK
jgi:hypothetical protein